MKVETNFWFLLTVLFFVGFIIGWITDQSLFCLCLIAGLEIFSGASTIYYLIRGARGWKKKSES